MTNIMYSSQKPEGEVLGHLEGKDTMPNKMEPKEPSRDERITPLKFLTQIEQKYQEPTNSNEGGKELSKTEVKKQTS